MPSRPRFHLGYLWMLVAACGPAGDDAPPADDRTAARQVLAGAYRALGGETAVLGVRNLFTAAEVQGPGDAFETLIWSSRDGSARMEQTTGFVGGFAGDSGWVWNADSGGIVPMDASNAVYVRGHELHALVLMPLTRFQDPVLAAPSAWEGDSALVVRVLDPTGMAVFLAYAPADTLPLGARFTALEPDVVVRLTDWSDVDAVRLFRQADFIQGGERYHYQYRVLEVNAVADSVWRYRSGGSLRPGVR